MSDDERGGNDDGSPPQSEGRTSHGAMPEQYAISPECSHREFLAVAKVYAREVVDAHDLSVSVSDLEWTVSTRAKRRAGAVEYRDGTPETITLAWRQFENNGWMATAATIRHELAHVHLINERGDPSHGAAFAELAERLDTHVRCERFTDPEWWVECRDCGAKVGRYRRSKLVTFPERYECGDCGGDLEVIENG